MSDPALAGLRVVDATEGIAGGYAAKVLRDLGADVTKVEQAGGDPLRRWSAATPDTPLSDTGALFSFLNAGKASVDVGDRAAVTDVLRAADVIVVATDVEVLDLARWQRARRAETSVVTISAFGADGPLAGARRPTSSPSRRGVASCRAAAPRDTPPLQMGIGHGQWATGAMAAIAALAANEHRARNGAGADVEVSALEVMAVCL